METVKRTCIGGPGSERLELKSSSKTSSSPSVNNLDMSRSPCSRPSSPITTDQEAIETEEEINIDEEDEEEEDQGLTLGRSSILGPNSVTAAANSQANNVSSFLKFSIQSILQRQAESVIQRNHRRLIQKQSGDEDLLENDSDNEGSLADGKDKKPGGGGGAALAAAAAAVVPTSLPANPHPTKFEPSTMPIW